MEGCGISETPHHRRRLAENALHNLSDGHSAWDRVGVHNDIRNHTVRRCEHVLLAEHHSDGPFLTVATGMLVSDGGLAMRSHAHFQEPISVSITSDRYFIHTTVFVVANRGAIVFVIEGSILVSHGTHLSDNHIVLFNERVFFYVSIFTNQTVIGSTHTNRGVVRRNTELLFVPRKLALLLVVAIGTVERGGE